MNLWWSIINRPTAGETRRAMLAQLRRANDLKEREAGTTMALDQHETFNWLVNEKTRIERQLQVACRDRDKWAELAFDLALKAAINNPALQAQIQREREGENVTADVLSFVLRSA